MASNRSNLTLDEQSFQDLLSAAFTIQAHNDQIKQARPIQNEREATSTCRHCGAPTPEEGSQCESCGRDALRPGERLQRNWASMWLMSQKQGLWPERSAEIDEGTETDASPLEVKRRPRVQAAPNFGGNGLLPVRVAKESARKTTAQERALHDPGRGNALLGNSEFGKSVRDNPALDNPAAESEWSTDAAEHESIGELATEDSAGEDSAVAVPLFPESGATILSWPTPASLPRLTEGPAPAGPMRVPWFGVLRTCV